MENGISALVLTKSSTTSPKITETPILINSDCDFHSFGFNSCKVKREKGGVVLPLFFKQQDILLKKVFLIGYGVV